MPAYITSIASAVPSNRFAQSQIANFMCKAMDLDSQQARKLQILYTKTKINYRHSVLPDYGLEHPYFQFYPQNQQLEPFPTVAERMVFYQNNAHKLAHTAAQKCLESHNTPPSSITHLITVSCTGMYAPGIDIDLVHSLALNTHTHRSAINFMGCYGAFNALKLAQSICIAEPNANVLVVTVELCTLHFQKNMSESNMLSNAIFADGAAAILLQSQPKGHALELLQFRCDLFAQGRTDMGWYVANHGFEMLLTSQVPQYIKSNIAKITTKLLEQAGVYSSQIQHFAIHPGGQAILNAVQHALELTENNLAESQHILQNYGNMSSSTVLFVIEKILQKNIDSGNIILATAFGPGLTLETMLLSKAKAC
jgi:alpha-pyrone synthase